MPLWYGQDQALPETIDLRDELLGPEMTIAAATIEPFCDVALRDDEPIIQVHSSFLYRGRFSDYGNAFQIIDEPDYVVELNDASSVGVLQSKERFD